MTAIRTRIKHWLGQYPLLFFPALKLTGDQNLTRLAFTYDTDIVIEGFPRSSNTFSVVAFEAAQNSDKVLNIAHHLHCEAQLIKACKMNVPAIALIRQAKPAISSYLIRHPEIDANWALQRYIQFYSNLLPHKDNIVFADFKTVTSDFGAIIRKVNEKFNTHFSEFSHSKEDEVEVFSQIENINEIVSEGKENFVARPSKERKELSEKQEMNLCPKKLDKANALYEMLTKN